MPFTGTYISIRPSQNSHNMVRPKKGSLLLSNPQLLSAKTNCDYGAVVEEIPGLIKLYKNGHVERLPAVQEVQCSYSPVPGVTSFDVNINRLTGLWARIYLPKCPPHDLLLPVLLYFHGGGFSVGSAAWRFYHEFLAQLASSAACVVVSANYRLAPEHRLPAAYEDGVTALTWLKQQASRAGIGPPGSYPWLARCDFGRVFLAGDSAGGAIAYGVALQVGATDINPLCLRGVILVQPFFGGEARTASERNLVQPSRSALSLAASDCYWRLALPAGCDRDHPWCNPLSGRRQLLNLESLCLPPVLICAAELDILRDRNLDLCRALRKAGKRVEFEMYAGVGHAFQVLHNYHLSQAMTLELLSDVKDFIIKSN